VINPTEWITVQRDINATRHAAKRDNKRTLCSGPPVSHMSLGLTRRPTSVERLLCHTDCLTCMRQLLRLLSAVDA